MKFLGNRITMKMNKVCMWAVAIVMILSSCQNNQQELPDKPYDGEMTIAVDRNYSRVMDEQVRVFQNQYPKVKINIIYENELQCLKDFLDGKVKMIFITRALTEEEMAYAKSHKIYVSYGKLARDGIALIVSKGAARRNFKQEEIKQIFSADDKSGHTVVFDDNNSSNAFYFRDSVLDGQAFNPKTYSGDSVSGVMSYVASNADAIGVIDMINVLQPSDEIVKSYLNQVDIVGVKTDSADYYWQPYPLYVATLSYPYTKSLYFILNESWQGLGHSFANFLSKEQGQLLFNNYDLFPLQYNVINREVELTHDSPF